MKLVIFMCLIGAALSASYIRRSNYRRRYDTQYDRGYDHGKFME